MDNTGMQIEFNGKKYTLLAANTIKDYAIGELMCELARLNTVGLKDIILKIPNFHDHINAEQIRETLKWIKEQLWKTYPPVTAEMLANAFYLYSDEFIGSGIKQKNAWDQVINQLFSTPDLKEHVLKNTEYDDFGKETNGQFLLTIYAIVCCDILLFEVSFRNLMMTDEDPEALEKLQNVLRFYLKCQNVQDIGYRIAYYNHRFNSIYTIKSIISLFLFDTAHVLDSHIYPVKCKNCGEYFIPQKRSDTRYCNYPSPQNPEKTCKEIGAQLTWAKKEKTDDVTREYRKVYMRLKMKVNRHPDNQEAIRQLERLTSGIKEWRKKLENKEAETAEFMEWLKEF